MSLLVVPKGVYQPMLLGKQTSDSHTNQYWQLVASKLMTEYDFEGHIEELRDLYRKRFYAMIDGLDKIDSSLLTYIRPTGGYFLCAKMTDDVVPEKFYDYLIDKKVAVIPGNVMSVDQTGFEHYFRLNFTKPSVEEMTKGMAIIGDALAYAVVDTQQREGA